jgi:rubredoxin
MVKYLKYYEKESSAHYTLQNYQLDNVQIEDLSNKTFEKWQVPRIVVQIDFKADDISKFSALLNEIFISHKMRNTLTVIHEIAHYVHYQEILASGVPLKNIRWHGPRHKEIVKLMAEDAIEWGYGRKPSKMFEPEPAVNPSVWWTDLPDMQHCNKCNMDYHKDDFGMAATKGKDGVKKFVRQSYCKHCRKAYYQAKKLGI